MVDSGVATYASGRLRDYCRSTRAHNTVEIEGEDQAELWAAFRVGRRCRPRAVDWRVREHGFELSGWHEGYRSLPARPTHARTFRWQREGRLEILDDIEAERPVRSVARLHFDSRCRIADLDQRTCELAFPGGRVRIDWSGWDSVAADESVYCPEFGVERANPCLAFSSTAARVAGAIRIALA